MRFLKDIQKYKNYIFYAGIADLKAEVAGSYLSWLWWVIEPTCFMLIYTFVFGVVFGAKEEYFPIFVFIGITMWNFFSNMCNYSVKAVKTNKSIVSKVYMPKYIMILSKMVTNGIKMLISFAIVAGMMVVWRVKVSVLLLCSIPVLFVFLFFTFGLCELLMHFGVYFTDLHKAIGIILKMVFYMTGIFYNVESRIGVRYGIPFGTILTKINPVALCLSSIRNVLLYKESPDVIWLFIWCLVGLLFAMAGTKLIYKNENSYVKMI